MEAEYPHAQVRRLDIATALIDGLVLQLHTSPWMPRGESWYLSAVYTVTRGEI